MSLNNIEEISFCIHQDAPKIHCLTNPVTMQDVANLLLAAGGSAVMGQDKQEVEEITSFCHGIPEYRTLPKYRPASSPDRRQMPLATRSSWIRSAPVPAHFEEKSCKNFFKPFIRLLFAVIRKKPLFYVLSFEIPTVPKNTAV